MTTSEKIALASLIIGILACIGTYLAVPEVRELISRMNDPQKTAQATSTSIPKPVGSSPIAQKEFGITPTSTQTRNLPTATTTLTREASAVSLPQRTETRTISPAMGQISLTIRAYVDGRSRLFLRGDSVYWLHFDWVAPGRGDGRNEPTYLNAIEWYPKWSDSPDRQNMDCKCQSSTYFGVPSLASQSQTIALSIVNARGQVTIIQQPNSSNEYTFIVEFDDDAISYSDWYEIKLSYISPTTARPTNTPTATSIQTSCAPIPDDWPKTPQEAAKLFGGQPFNWHPDYYLSGNSIKWDNSWSFQSSPLQQGVTLSTNGNYIDSQGNILKLPYEQRCGRLWDCSRPPTLPSLRLGKLGTTGRALMLTRSGGGSPNYPNTKRWGFGSATFDEAEGGTLWLVQCASNQLLAAAQETERSYNASKLIQDGHRNLLWNESTKRFEEK